MRVLAIDPGDVHCGMATFLDGQCTSTWEDTPADCLGYVRSVLEGECLDVLVVEEFRLYPWKAQQQAYSQMLTCQLIGGIKAAWSWFGSGSCKLVEQSATIKKPTVGILRARGIKSKAKQSKAGGHALDAELHGYYYVLKGSA